MQSQCNSPKFPGDTLSLMLAVPTPQLWSNIPLGLVTHVPQRNINGQNWMLRKKAGKWPYKHSKYKPYLQKIFRIKEFVLSFSRFQGSFWFVWGFCPYYLNVSCSLLPSFSVFCFFFILCPSVFPRVQFNYPQFYFQAGCIVFWGLASSHIHLFIGSFCLQMNSKLQLRVKRKLTKPEMRVN